MSPESQRIAIAEACGWEHIAFNRGWIKAGDGETQCVIPDYLNDLNAMHEAEYVLYPSQYKLYIKTIAGLLPPFDSDTARFADFMVGNANAAQRAEAFLRTIGKWKDAK